MSEALQNQTLQQRIVRHIQLNGALPLAEYMHICLSDEKQGYYKNATVFGENGDFITAPEISQMFGELLGIWAISAWQALGEPESFNLVEFGPGRGTLMSDLLRSAKLAPKFLSSAAIHLIETSEKLRDLQTQTLSEYDNISWHETHEDLPPEPTLIIANELLDALPFHQYVKTKDGWFERVITLNENEQLSFAIGHNQFQEAFLPSGHEEEPEGAIFETSPSREAFIQNICEFLKTNQGAALFIDYGHIESGFGDTFQAVKSHAPIDPLENPGEADLTSHIDFAPLEKVAVNCQIHTYPTITQGEFLLKLGLLERAGQLGQSAGEEIRLQLTKQAERLALPVEMGDLFKVFAIAHEQLDIFPFTRD